MPFSVISSMLQKQPSPWTQISRMAQFLHHDLKSILLARQSNHMLFWHESESMRVPKLTRACNNKANVPGVGGLRYGLSLGPLKSLSQHRISPKKQYCPFTVSPHKLCLIKMLFFFSLPFEHLVLISPWRRVILSLSPNVGQI